MITSAKTADYSMSMITARKTINNTSNMHNMTNAHDNKKNKNKIVLIIIVIITTVMTMLNNTQGFRVILLRAIRDVDEFVFAAKHGVSQLGPLMFVPFYFFLRKKAHAHACKKNTRAQN
jgi:hypothetical protein